MHIHARQTEMEKSGIALAGFLNININYTTILPSIDKTAHA